MLGRHVEYYVSLPVHELVARCNGTVQHECSTSLSVQHDAACTLLSHAAPDDRAPTLQPSEWFEKTEGWDPWGGV